MLSNWLDKQIRRLSRPPDVFVCHPWLNQIYGKTDGTRSGAKTTNKAAGLSLWVRLYNDFRCVVMVADRSDFLWFANSLPEIIKASEVEEQKVIDELRNGFDALRKVAELHK